MMRKNFPSYLLGALAACAQGCTIVPNPDVDPESTTDSTDATTDVQDASDESHESKTSSSTNADDKTSGRPTASDDDSSETTTSEDTEQDESTNDAGSNSSDSDETSEGEPHDGGFEPTTDDEPSDSSSDEPDPVQQAEAPTFDCGTPDLESARIISGTVSADETWSGTIIIDGQARVQGADITIEPGTHFVMKVDSSLTFGWNDSEGFVKAKGTVEQPITFCGEEPESGFWSYIEVNDTVTSNSELRNVLVQGGGANGALWLEAPLAVENVVVRQSKTVGVVASDFKEGSSGLFVSESGAEPVVLATSGAATRFPIDSGLTDNGSNVVALTFTGIDGEATLHDLGIPYVQREANWNPRSDSKLTIEAGVEIRFGADTQLDVGFGETPTIVINGTEDRPVVFRGEEETPGYWFGFWVESGVPTNAKISHLVLKHAGGGGNAAFYVNSPIQVSHLTLEDNLHNAFIGERGLATGSTNWKISGTQDHPLRISAPALLSLPAESQYTGNQTDRIEVVDSTILQSGTIREQDVPYEIVDGIFTREGASVTIEPGTTFLMGPDTQFVPGYADDAATMTWAGTQDKPIVFRGLEDTAGFWSGIRVDNNVASNSSFEWLEVHDAGGEGLDAALVIDVAVPVTNSVFANSAGFGIVTFESNTTDYATSNTFENNASGDLGTY